MDFANLEVLTAMIVQHEELSAKVKAGESEYQLWHADNYRCLRAAAVRFVDQAQQLRRDNGGSGYSCYLQLAESLLSRKWKECLELLESFGIVHLDGDEPTEQ
jgi:hypothetical protein